MNQVRYIGVSNETSYGVMEFVHAAKVGGLPKIVSIQNCYSLVARCRFEGMYNSDMGQISFTSMNFTFLDGAKLPLLLSL